MPPVVANLDTFQTTTDGTSFVSTNTVAPAATRLLVLAVIASSGTADPSSVSAFGLTWTIRGTGISFGGGGRCSVYTAVTGGSAPTPGVVTVTYAASVTGFSMILDEVSAADLTTPMAQTPVTAQAALGTTNPVVATFASTPAAGNLVLLYGGSTANFTQAPEAGYTTHVVAFGPATPTRRLGAHWATGADSTPQITFSGSTVNGLVYAMEVAAAAGGLTVAIAQAVQTGIALPFTANDPILRTVNRAAETGSALALAGRPPQFRVTGRCETVEDAQALFHTQKLRPSSDVSAGTWTASTGTALWDMVNEPVAIDTDYIMSPTSPPTAVEAKLRVPGTVRPVSGVGTLRYRYFKDVSVGDAIDLTVTLYRSNGTTVVQSATHMNISEVAVNGVMNLTSGTVDAVPAVDWVAGLVIGFRAVVG